MGLELNITGTKAVISALEGELNRRKGKTGKMIQIAGILTEGEAKQNCPVDTGYLKSSIAYHKIDTLSCTVGTPVKYAPYVEFGTSKMSAHPFLFPAFVKYRQLLFEHAQKLAESGSDSWAED